ncbi:MAG TPA: hypothetical protein VHV82_14740 [Sporichthyaceae bacterium]|jgi:hypothetical protein|nr:hypothetical protein [Sporichthyaceae bacterium]
MSSLGVNPDADPTFQIMLPRPMEAVWLAFRDPEFVRRWYGWEFDGLDEEIKALFVEGAVADRAARTIHLGGHLFTLNPAEANTHLVVSRRAPVVVDDDIDWDAQYDDIEESWIAFLQQCRFAMARHPQQRRRTIFRAGAARSAIPTPVGDLLGLSGAARTPAGEPYVAEVGTGERLEGEVWYRTTLQLGVTVDAWGDGLLILAHPPSAPEPFVLTTMTLTTYGLDDTALADLETRWGRWWSARYEEA